MNKDKRVSYVSRRNIFVFSGILLLLVIVSNLATYMITEKVTAKNPAEKPYEFLNSSLAFVKSEDMIVDFQSLRDELEGIGKKDSRISIYFEFLNTGANIAVNKDAAYWPASLLKLPVAMAVTRKVEKGEWKWDNQLVLMTSDKDERSGDLYRLPIGTKLTIEKLVNEMLATSDNTAYSILLRNLEPEEFQDIYDHLGLQKFLDNDGDISAKNYSVMLRSLYNASYLNEENSEKLLGFLSETPFDEYLGSAIPDTVKFSHKVGLSDDHKAFLDAGIIYVPSRPYILIVMIATKDNEEAEKVMNDISTRVYKYVVGYTLSKL